MPAKADVVYRWTVSVNGSPLPPAVHERLVAGTVQQSIHLPDSVLLEIEDPDSTAIADGAFRIGAALVVSVISASNTAGTKVFVGEVTGLECEYDGLGQRTVIRGYDGSHRLHRGRHTAAYVNSTYTDIVRKVVQRAGLTAGQMDASGAVHAHVAQANVDDWTFLRGLAAEIGFTLAVEEGKVCFRTPAAASSAPAATKVKNENPLELYVGDRSVIRARVALTGCEQVSSSSVRGWDMVTKQAIVGVAPAPSSHHSVSLNGNSPANVGTPFGSATETVVADGPASQAVADAAAKATASRVGGGFAEAEIETFGNPKLHPGEGVGLGGVGAALSGRYVISAARHTLDTVSGYRTVITVSDRQERSLLSLTASAPEPSSLLSGVVPAIVTNNNDTEHQLGRVKLKFPWLDDTYESDWARVIQPGAGATRGFQIIPEVNDEVLVAFEQGDPNRPYVLAGLHNGRDKPKAAQTEMVRASQVRQRVFYSRTGHNLLFVDDQGPQGSIVLQLGDGKTTVTLGGTPTGGVTVDTDRDVKVTTKMNASVQATGNVEVKGLKVTVQAETELELKAAVVKIDAQGPIEARGAIIKLN
jgi:phage protein D